MLCQDACGFKLEPMLSGAVWQQELCGNQKLHSLPSQSHVRTCTITTMHNYHIFWQISFLYTFLNLIWIFFPVYVFRCFQPISRMTSWWGPGWAFAQDPSRSPWKRRMLTSCQGEKARHLSADSMIFDMHIEYIRVACCTTVMMTHIDSYSYL